MKNMQYVGNSICTQQIDIEPICGFNANIFPVPVTYGIVVLKIDEISRYVSTTKAYKEITVIIGPL